MGVGGRGIKEYNHRRPLKSHSHVQRISSLVRNWGSDHSVTSPSRDALHVRAANEFIIADGASPTSNASAPLAPNDAFFYVAVVLGDRVSARETDFTEGAANRTRSTTAARWGKLAGRVVIPSRSGLVLHLSSELSQDVGV